MVLTFAFPMSAPEEEFARQWLRSLSVSIFISSSVVLAAGLAWAERQCNVPAGYYSLVDREDDGVIELRQSPSHRAKLLAALAAGDVVQSDGTRSPDAGSALTVWQQVTILQTVGWVPARKLWRTLPLTIAKSDVPASGHCGDSSPVWSVSWTSDRLRLSLFPGRYELPIQSVTRSGNSSGTLVTGSSAGVSYHFVYADDVCRNANGEMIGIGRASLIVDRDGAEQIYTGCCTAAPDAFVNHAPVAVPPAPTP